MRRMAAYTDGAPGGLCDAGLGQGDLGDRHLEASAGVSSPDHLRDEADVLSV